MGFKAVTNFAVLSRIVVLAGLVGIVYVGMGQFL